MSVYESKLLIGTGIGTGTGSNPRPQCRKKYKKRTSAAQLGIFLLKADTTIYIYRITNTKSQIPHRITNTAYQIPYTATTTFTNKYKYKYKTLSFAFSNIYIPFYIFLISLHSKNRHGNQFQLPAILIYFKLYVRKYSFKWYFPNRTCIGSNHQLESFIHGHHS